MVELFIAGFYRPDADSGQESGSPVTRPSTPHVSRVERASQPGPLGRDLRKSPLTRFELPQPLYEKDIEKRFPVAPTPIEARTSREHSPRTVETPPGDEVSPRSGPSRTVTALTYRIERRDYSQGRSFIARRLQRGLLRRASVEPDKHISMHPALRVSIIGEW